MSKRKIDVIVIDDSDDEQDSPATHKRAEEDAAYEKAMAMAMQLSREEHQRSSSRAGQSSSSGAAEHTGSSSNTNGTNSAGGLSSRQQMELERVARAEARLAAGTASRTALRPPRVQTLGDLQDDGDSSTGAGTRQGNVHGFGSSTSSGSAAQRSSTRFWEGAIRRVSNRNVPDQESYKFGDLIDKKDGLKMAIVGAFCLDVEWVCAHFDAATPLLLFKPKGKGEPPGNIYQVDEAIKPNTFCVIPEEKTDFNGWSSMHTKLIVLYHSTFCRIVVSSANALSYDWDTMDNVFYVHDFPLLKTQPVDPDPRKNPTHTQFSKELLEVMKSLSITKKFVAPYRDFDFSKSQDVRLVATTSGIWKDWRSMEEGGGVCALATAVSSLGLSSKGGRWEIETQCSSIGNYSKNWLAQFLGAASGVHPSSYFKTSTTPPHLPRDKALDANALPIKIVFPTLAEVEGSWGGVGHGGTIFCPGKYWRDKNFPKRLFHRGVSTRNRVTAHTKTIVAIHKPTKLSPASFKPEGWIYVGSHNFTPAAWGSLQNSSGGAKQLRAPNYELGVVLPIRGDSLEAIEAKASALATYRRPLVRYSDSDKPWSQDEHPSFQE